MIRFALVFIAAGIARPNHLFLYRQCVSLYLRLVAGDHRARLSRRHGTLVVLDVDWCKGVKDVG